ncbi:MAG: MFS transporter [Paraprevotella sp.]|nr:MFS transporter [Paraprevotella sp.]
MKEFGCVPGSFLISFITTGAMKSETKQDTSSQVPSTKLWNREYIKVMLCNFLLFFAFYLLTPLLPLYLAEQFHTDKDTIGLVLSGYVVATLVVRPFSGFVVDSFDRKKVLTVCFFFFFIFFAGYIGAVTLLMFAIVRTLHGIPFGATTVVNSTVAIDVLPSERRNEGIGYYGLSNNLAMAVAPSAGIYIYHISGNFMLLFWLSLLLAFIGFLCSTTVRLPRCKKVAGRPKLSLDHFFLTRAWLLAVNICFFGLCWGVMSNYVALYGKEELGITDGTGLFFMLLSTGLFVSRLFGAKSLRAGRMTHNATIGVLLSSVGYAMFALIVTPWSYYLSAFLIGLGNGRMYPAFLSMFINVARHDQRGTANSSILISWDLGMGMGILLGGFIAEQVGFLAAFYTVALMQGAGALLFIFATTGFFNRRRLEGV